MGDYHESPPPSYEEAMAENVRQEAISRSSSECSTAQDSSTIIKADLVATEKLDTTIWKRRTKKEEIEVSIFNGKLSKRAINRNDACVITAMAISVMGLSLVPLYCGWCCIRRSKWSVDLTNKGLHWTKYYLHKSFIPLQDIRHICLESEHGSVVVVTTKSGRVRLEWVENAAELVRAVRRVKGWPQLRILTE